MPGLHRPSGNATKTLKDELADGKFTWGYAQGIVSEKERFANFTVTENHDCSSQSVFSALSALVLLSILAEEDRQEPNPSWSRG